MRSCTDDRVLSWHQALRKPSHGLKSNGYKFIRKEDWPANSPDLSPMDYSINGICDFGDFGKLWRTLADFGDFGALATATLAKEDEKSRGSKTRHA
ncbi:hypothetical protein BV898_17449 [Hypsibius exemplaris]|uniref:Uncharacterized protein n=1 Tax=Hypsibius exemplaris TaxID=2072580 RepID=A0A9X6NFI7_HYPEX|nr:hypothetical protein BV898_17449 [Hypsibius exemplaris]